MLFNSYEFIFAFLPAALLTYYAFGRSSATPAKITLAAASLIFYSFWKVSYLPLLVGSVLFNWYASKFILAEKLSPTQRNAALIAALAANLGLLCYYKYFAFLVGLLGGNFTIHADTKTLPLGISFFTFTQIAFLVDARKGMVHDHTFLNYLLFVTVFPHLIAGPILHHRSIIPQFGNRQTYRFNAQYASKGLMLFAIGLAKKVLLADAIAPHADVAFAAASPTLIEAWCGATAYTLQIYFDFSGYSDMAVGLGLMLGLRLPINFNSPYQSTSIIDFWRRWHMTLSMFLRDYLYKPLGGNRRGQMRRWLNLMVTMILGGLWHGANLTFVVWGGMHGICLVINHIWRYVRTRIGIGECGLFGRLSAWALTFLVVVVSWVLFRAEDLSAAQRMLSGLAGMNGVVLPKSYAALPLFRLLIDMGWPTGNLPTFKGVEEIAWLVALAAIALLAPNSQSIVLGKTQQEEESTPSRFIFNPSASWALICTGLLTAAILGISKESVFLYFQF